MRDGVSISALIGLDSLDNAMNAITFSERIADLLEDEDAAALCSTIPVGRRIKRLALAGGTKEVSTIEAEIHLSPHSEYVRSYFQNTGETYIRTCDHIGTSDQGCSAISGFHGPDSLVHGHH